MRFLSSYVWRQEERCSVVLQQVRRRRGGLAVLLGCVSEDGEFAERLTDWFHERALPRCRKGAAEKVTESVQECFRVWMEQNGTDAAFAVLFCAGEECFYAWRGEMEIQVMNIQFGRTQARSLIRWTEGYGCERAVLEENVGLFLGSSELYGHFPQEVFRSCLTAVDLNSQQQADRHLEEACQEAARGGAESTAAIIVVTKGYCGTDTERQRKEGKLQRKR